jgi:hypothetical protein
VATVQRCRQGPRSAGAGRDCRSKHPSHCCSCPALASPSRWRGFTTANAGTRVPKAVPCGTFGKLMNANVSQAPPSSPPVSCPKQSSPQVYSLQHESLTSPDCCKVSQPQVASMGSCCHCCTWSRLALKRYQSIVTHTMADCLTARACHCSQALLLCCTGQLCR